ncbi:glycosyltransferase family 9 protein [Streptomyces aurantiacus]|uniref:glycosyltransferase family 9 protein n=1 Tax=Streptomyces aurantiacus TaxID=47760 RepID=UPI0006E134CD|nr:glycosyltransferase family 9 protein [Streptomyces aurantiacus]
MPASHAASRTASRTASGTGSGTGSRPRLLILRALGLGDLLAGVPALRGVRRTFPGHEIVLAAPAALRDAALATGTVDTLFPAQAPGRGVPSLDGWRGTPPDLAIDLHGNGPESHDALAALEPRRLLSYARPDGSAAPAPVWRRDEHERERWCRFLRAYGIDADPGDVRLPPPSGPSPAPGAVVVHPGAEAPARRWPARRYAAVVRRLRAAGRRVVVTGGPGEEELTGYVADSCGLGDADVLAGGLPFAELSALVAGAACLLSGDTGPAHLAVAHGTPSVTLFGPVAPHLWGPPPGPRHVALWHPGRPGDPPGDPHGREPDPSLLRIGTAEVAAAVLAHTERPERSGPVRPQGPAEAVGHA